MYMTYCKVFYDLPLCVGERPSDTGRKHSRYGRAETVILCKFRLIRSFFKFGHCVAPRNLEIRIRSFSRQPMSLCSVSKSASLYSS